MFEVQAFLPNQPQPQTLEALVDFLIAGGVNGDDKSCPDLLIYDTPDYSVEAVKD